ncbi:hypothetical protein J2B92_10045 [Lysinibacillus sphaericus]|uniref:insecticidal delta-endotoxin Cry8Ea1 family protein n=1 Tax=Lysinibacillus sphaericus TaxID=1421 RepID=UPI0018CF7B3B|nr:insecticidal delta-endotoxin Cry8Ea1 family protein [Lysinibacillus sphaericus]MBG9755946.1 hypothetical protein [Lysinibacillus sphaericus]QTB15491.1 hypothetical protein J2B92_10045 [Lysinibacillus sphaericus]
MEKNKESENDVTNSYLSPQSYLKKPIHPILANPNFPLQSNNYKNWINMCNESSVLESFDSITAISTGSIVFGTMLAGVFATASFAGPIGIIGAIIISFGTILPLLFTEDQNQKNSWTEFIRMGERYVDITISETVKAQVLGKLNDIKENLMNYEEAFFDWIELKKQQKPGSPPSAALRNAADIVHDRLEGINRDFGALGMFSISPYQTILLPVYAQAANLHLNLLQQGSMFADKWIQDKHPTKNNEFAGTSDNYQKKLESKIKEYITYVEKTYKDGLFSLSNEPNMTWSIYNDYRREMTLTALDIITIFPFYNRKEYDTTIGVKTELTRELYLSTSVRDSAINEFFAVDNTEAILKNKPSLFYWLKQLDIKTLLTPKGNILIGNRNVFQPTNNLSRELHNYQQLWNFQPFPYELMLQEFRFNSHINKIVMSEISDAVTTNITLLRFYLDDELIALYNSGDSNPHTSTTLEIPNHYLSCLNSYYPIRIKNKGIDGPASVKLQAFGWTHNCVDYDNEISKDRITQIPAVKGNFIGNRSRVIKGSGHHGGDLVLLNDRLDISCLYRNPSPQEFRIRVRYASNHFAQVSILTNNNNRVNGILRPTNFDLAELNYDDFLTLDLNGTFTLNSVPVGLPYIMSISKINISTDEKENLIIDKIEFVPITQKEKLEQIQIATNSLFTSPTKNTLKIESTDYQINQIAMQIESLPEEFYSQEKLMLSDDIKHAKHLNQSRNLLQIEDFQSLSGWFISNSVSVERGNQNFKDYILLMPGASTSEINNYNFPTYIYQQIDESKLKPYSRYLVRGFVKDCKELEVFVSRYNKEIQTIMNVRGDDINLLNTNEQPNDCHNTQTFSFSIDTGNLDFNECPGFEILFQISNSEGYASLSNLEVLEERLLTEKEKQHIIEIEERWRAKKVNQHIETEKVYNQAQQAIDNLFIDTQYSKLKFETTKHNINTADAILDTIPYVYNSLLPNEPGMNYDLFKNLKNLIYKAYTSFKLRNTIKNGDFTNGTENWSISAGIKIEKTDNEHILVIPNWSAQVSQQIQLEKQNRYLLRVIAKKEGMGNGYVKISDCLYNIAKIDYISSEYYTINKQNSLEYITKTIQFIPNTDKVHIELGETEGVFKIKSIELICINN